MKSMFDTRVAQISNMQVASFIECLAGWIKHNKANKKHFHIDRFWSYNSQEAWLQYFPFLTISQIKTTIKNAIDAGLLLTGNFNERGYDRTIWYSLTDKALEYYPELKLDKSLILNISEKSLMDKRKIANGLAKNRRPIPCIKTISKNTSTKMPVIGNFSLSEKEKTEILNARNKSMSSCVKIDSVFLDECIDHMVRRKQERPDLHRNQIFKGLITLINSGNFNQKLNKNTNLPNTKQQTAQEYAKERQLAQQQNKLLEESKRNPDNLLMAGSSIEQMRKSLRGA